MRSGWLAAPQRLGAQRDEVLRQGQIAARGVALTSLAGTLSQQVTGRLGQSCAQPAPRGCRPRLLGEQIRELGLAGPALRTALIGVSQADGLGDSQVGPVVRGLDRTVAGNADCVEEAGDFLGARHDRQPGRLLGGGQDLGDVPVLVQTDPVEEAQGGDGDADRGGRELPFRGQEQLVDADLPGAEQVRDLPRWPANSETWQM